MTQTTKTILTAAVLLLINFNVQAADIEQGTFSIGGTSNLLFRQDESSIYEKMKEVSFNVEAGYFFFKNWEFGIDSEIRFIKYEDSDDSQLYSLSPFISRYFSLNRTSNLYLRFGAKYGYAEYDYDFFNSDTYLTGIFGKLGYEYFLTDAIALDFGILAGRYWYNEKWEAPQTENTDYDEGKYHNTTNRLTTQFKLKFYF